MSRKLFYIYYKKSIKRGFRKRKSYVLKDSKNYSIKAQKKQKTFTSEPRDETKWKTRANQKIVTEDRALIGSRSTSCLVSHGPGQSACSYVAATPPSLTDNQ